MSSEQMNEQSEAPANESGTISGRWVVIGIFAFAVLVVFGMWLYIDRHTAPFRPLRRALAREFLNSAPKVEGGQTKMNAGTPHILRIVMRVEFNPNADTAEAKRFAHRVAEFAQQHHDLTQYEVIEIHLYYAEPENKIQEWSIELKPSELAPVP
jgi:hypothetical protein